MPYRIVNNVIYMSPGETPTYDVKAMDRSTGAPYVLPVDRYDATAFSNIVISFVVKDSTYDRDETSVLKKYIWKVKEDEQISDVVLLSTESIYEYNDDVWSNDYTFDGGQQPHDGKILYRRKVNGMYDYRYYDSSIVSDGEDNQWIPYEFRIVFPFQYEDTNDIIAKQYKYEVTLYAGADLKIVEDKKGNKQLENIVYKEVFLQPTDFILEGTTSE